MKTQINSRTDGLKVVDLIGDNEAKIEQLENETKKLKKLFEEWALAHQDDAFKGDLMEGETEKYSFAMLKGDPALRIQPQLSMSDVVARLGADAEAAKYVTNVYDAKAIKADFGRTAAKRKAVENYGLYFTRPQPHLSVVGRLSA